VQGSGHHLLPTFAGRPAPTGSWSSCLCGSLPASESCRSTSITAGEHSPAGRLLQDHGHLVFVGACLQANRTGPQASPQANIRRQAGSYRIMVILSLWELACKRIVPVHKHHRRRTFAGRPAPTGACVLVFVGACLQANRTGPQASPQANIRRQAGSYLILSLWELACKRRQETGAAHAGPSLSGQFPTLAVCPGGRSPANPRPR
jgi:hypothetical protein